MPPKKIRKKSMIWERILFADKRKIQPDILAYVLCSLIMVSTAYIITVIIASGVAMFFNPYIAYVRENREKNYDNIKYATDKTEYILGEAVKLSLINNLKESIYLAPCKYFKHFEMKKSAVSGIDSTASVWQPVNLPMSSDCDNNAFNGNAESFNKIKKSTDEYVLTSDFGAGIFRGVSIVFLKCSKPDIVTCKTGLMVYSNEFKINPNIAETDNTLKDN